MEDSNVNGDLYLDNNSGGYRTCDLYLAAFFISTGNKLINHERDPRTKRVYFIFEKNSLINELKMNYFGRKAKVEALNFADNIKSLKSLCHNTVNDTARI